jgi:hypothetical protein
MDRADEQLRALEGTSPTLQRTAYRQVLSKVTEASWWVQHAPRVNIWCWPGCDWSIIYTGSNYHSAELQHLLYSDKPAPALLGRVNIWNLPAETKQWTQEADLVVCELNRRQPRASTTGYIFTMAPWVRMVLDVSPPAETLMANLRKDIRYRLRKTLKNGFTCRASHSEADFHFFYHSMFLPFLETRFQERGVSAAYDDLLAEFSKGGLIVVERNGQSVSGMMYLHTDQTLYSTWGGVLHGDYELMREGVQVARWWFAIQLAQQMGCRYYDLGRALASLQNGLFDFKLGWGAQVWRDHRLHETWTFISQNLPVKLRAQLNDQQFLGEVEGHYYLIFLSDPQDALDQSCLNEKLQVAQAYRLSGVLVVTPGHCETRSLS